VALLAFLAAFATLATPFPHPKQTQTFPVRQALSLLGQETLLVFGFMLFLQSGMEITVGGWASTFAHETLALNERNALYFLSLYWLGTLLARLIFGSVLKKTSPALVLACSQLLAFIGLLLLLTSHAAALAALGIFLVGAGFAAVFTVVLGWLGERYQALSGTAFSLALVMALCGGMLLPYLTGVFGEAYGMRASLVIVPIALCGSLILHLIARIRGLT
jgi:fucose permease